MKVIVNKLNRARQKYSNPGITTSGYEKIKKRFYGSSKEEQPIEENQSPQNAEELFKVFFDLIGTNKYETAMPIGRTLAETMEGDYEVLNMVGNCCRKMQEYKDANNYYRRALKCDPSNPIAFYNLAASLAMVDLYDIEAQKALEPFLDNDDYFFCDFVGGKDYLNDLVIQIKDKKKFAQVDHLQSLILEKEMAEYLQDDGKKSQYSKEIESFKFLNHTPTYNEVVETIKSRIEQRQTTEEEMDCRYNLGLFALKNGDGELAEQCFQQLKLRGARYKHLEMLFALSMAENDKLDVALEKMGQIWKQDSYNRLVTLNLGMLYRKKQNMLVSMKFFLLGNALLEKTEGLIGTGEILNRANAYVKSKNIKQALKLYQFLVREDESVEALYHIFDISIAEDNHETSYKTLLEIKRIRPQSEETSGRIDRLHEYYHNKAEHLYRNSKMEDAAYFYDLALSLKPTSELFKKASQIHAKLENKAKAKEMLDAFYATIQYEKDKSLDNKHKEYMENGKKYLKEQEYYHAIENFKNAFELKPEKNTFMFLAHIYKGLNHQVALQNLISRWKQLSEINEYRSNSSKNY